VQNSSDGSQWQEPFTFTQRKGGGQLPGLPEPEPQKNWHKVPVVTVDVDVDVVVTLPPLPHTLALPLPPQVSGKVQVPQFNVPPQPSSTVPQFAHCTAHVVGVQPQRPGVPPPPQVPGGVHIPQEPPQPSLPHDLFVQSGVQSVVVVGALVVVEVGGASLRLSTVKLTQLSTRDSFASSSSVVKQSARSSALAHFAVKRSSAFCKQSRSTDSFFWTALA
jgi:hypothetical protein